MRSRLACFGVVLALLLAFFVTLTTADCPASEYLAPFGCVCYTKDRVRCRNVDDERRLRLIMTACEGHELMEFELRNATLKWLPDQLLRTINTRDFILSYSTLSSITKPSNNSRLFESSGVKTFVLDHTVIEDGDLSHIADLDELEDLAIRGYQMNLFFAPIARSLDENHLRSLMLEDNPGLVLGEKTLQKFWRLTFLSLSGQHLQSVSREDLPETVDLLENLWLKNNQLREIPPEFLLHMPRLQTLDISNNSITTLDEDTFRMFHGSLGLHGNPLRCDSNLEWLRFRVRQGSLRLLFSSKVLCDDGTPLVDF